MAKKKTQFSLQLFIIMFVAVVAALFVVRLFSTNILVNALAVGLAVAAVAWWNNNRK